jgi:hypothetical protein
MGCTLATPTLPSPIVPAQPGQLGQPSTSSLPPSQQGMGEAYIDDVLGHSTIIEDPITDRIVTGHEGDNPGIYPADFVDITSLEIGLDDEYLYVKISLYGILPEEVDDFPVFDGDQLHDFALNLAVDTDNDSHTGCISDGGAEALLGFGFHNENGMTNTSTGYATDPTGIESPETARYHNRVFPIGIQFGGQGEEHYTMAIPLSALRITGGQSITINTWVESSSDRYHHASYDILCPESLIDTTHPMVCPIEFTVGEERIVE